MFKYIIKILSIIAFVTVSIVLLRPETQDETQLQRKVSIYSWEIDSINYSELEKIIKKLDINSFYQYSYNIKKDDEFKELINKLKEFNVNTYLLEGSPEYAYDDNNERMKEIIDDVYAFNKINKTKISGIIFDVEFYLDKENYREESKDECYTKYVNNMKKVYNYAKQRNVKISLVIPYWYDTEFDEQLLEILIRDACDCVEVMNYYKTETIEHIKNEYEFAKKYNKEIVTISELQEPDNEEVTEIISFHNEGIDAARIDMESILKTYNYDKFGYAYHFYDSIVELY